MGATRANSTVHTLPTTKTGLRPRLSAVRQPTKMNPAKKNTEIICMPRHCCCEKPSVDTP